MLEEYICTNMCAGNATDVCSLNFIEFKALITSDNTGTQYLLVQRMQTISTLLKGIYVHMHLLENYNFIDKQFTLT